MGIAEEQRALDRTYRAALPEIVGHIESRSERAGASDEIARAYGIDDRTAFKWLQITEEQLERARKRVAVTLLLLLWITVLGEAVFFGLWLSGSLSLAMPVRWVIAGLIGILAGTVGTRLVGYRKRVYRSWLRKEVPSL